MQCGFCNILLDTASSCPNCNEIVILKYPLSTRLNPFATISLTIKHFTGKAGMQLMICPACDYKAPDKEFPRVLLFGDEYSLFYKE